MIGIGKGREKISVMGSELIARHPQDTHPLVPSYDMLEKITVDTLFLYPRSG